MKTVHKVFGRVCEHCHLCNHARENKDGRLYKIMDSRFHGSWCPSWQGYKKLEAEGKLKSQQQKTQP
jgi:hypothetical protein